MLVADDIAALASLALCTIVPLLLELGPAMGSLQRTACQLKISHPMGVQF